MNKTSLTGIILLLVIGCGGGGNDVTGNGSGLPQPAPGTGIILGKLSLESNSSEANLAVTTALLNAVGVTVKLEEDESLSDVTDADGNFLINNVPEGTWTIYAELAGDNGERLAIRKPSIVVIAGNVIDLGTLTLNKTGAIQGIVQLEGESDYIGIDVYIPGTSFLAKTDSQGNFTILYIPEGTYDVRAEKAGFNPYLFVNISVTSGQVSSLPAITLTPPPSPWATKAPMLTARAFPAAAELNGILYAVGGRNSSGDEITTVEAYDPTTNTWSTKSPMPTAREALAVGVVNGVLYAVGGAGGPTGGEAATKVEAYDPVTNTWTTKASMPYRSTLAAAIVNGILYAVGGQPNTGDCTTATVDAYNPVTNTWTTKASMPTARLGHAVGVVNGILYAIGGTSTCSYGDALTTVEAYDPATDTWTTKAPMPTSRAGLGIGVVNGNLYALGGESNSGLLATVEAYDAATDKWTTTPLMPTPRYGFATAAADGILYAIGGYSGTALTTVEAYTP